MGDDLGAEGGEVHALAGSILAFWFALPPEKHFAKDDDLDAEVGARFGNLRDAVLASGARDWRSDPESLLAAILLLDQFSRNLYRGTARAFEADALALELTMLAIARGWDQGMTPDRRQFLYMPLMHAEDPEMQALCIEKFAALGGPSLAFAHDHAAVIERFGRFPSRNAALGRSSTPAEKEYLSQPGAGW